MTTPAAEALARLATIARAAGAHSVNEYEATVRAALALAGDAAFWSDCRWQRPSDEPRSVETCGLEGTHVCVRCQLAAARAETAALRELLKEAVADAHGYGLIREHGDGVPFKDCTAGLCSDVRAALAPPEEEAR